jgi:hypothetical protein
MMETKLDELQAKMNRLEDFVVRLRSTVAPNALQREMNLALAACVERLLKIGDSDELSKCFDLCQERMAEI